MPLKLNFIFYFELISVSIEYFGIYGSRKIQHELKRSYGIEVNHKVAENDRGSQYCSVDYQNLLKAGGFVCSMSRKGNCWDNAPMESFWGKLKQEWLNEQHFKTRDEAKKAVFEYIWIFYNRKRIHEANGYKTPEEYYNDAA